MDNFKLFTKYDSLNAICVTNMCLGTVNYDLKLEKSIDNRYTIRRESDIDSELQNCFIYDGYYCSNMKSYIFLIGDCVNGLLETFYDEFTKFIVKYNINPVDFYYVIGDGCDVSDDMKLKLSRISAIQLNLHDYS